MRWWWDVSRPDYGGTVDGTPVPADAALRDRLDAALRQAAPAIQEVLTAEGIPTLPPQG